MADQNKNIVDFSDLDDDQRQITLVDEKGNEELYEILFTFDSEDFNRSYVLLIPAGAQEDEQVDIYPFAYTPDENGDATSGDLQPIEDDDEWDMVQGVLDVFLHDENLSD
ncbi:MAG TPA: DUF1292 domain-containing protein [Lapidilactobacillus dextrinicus]|jgi:uncharacterized protein YrzB (UPF0473 family)|uniref:UPF0473 protein FC84_GL000886 n=2 Tax=Lapidilactobacillus dextrinicus TaxID=51664 RepID=A0A0R2BFM0_9LACO|nr:DUF1292 domain-containing protein [Lapidilactobacillus dextrinicus]KRM78445.1 hypothetical protein FC84_GL000886 [Lapidilactobacillus dextrinicus DSM 20335]QFG47244.1 DUF1292 domain-containing protein [Lapidilactobacillus dextrinicus]HJE15961.1 DUF1292 domain-containing protein [Lapidilactobacillus dextrinicus]